MDRSHLSQLVVLNAVVRCGSFRAAATELAIAPSAVSHAVARLEAHIGVRLLARSTRHLALTEEGAALLERLKPALAEIDRAVEAAKETRKKPAGNLRLTAPRTAAELILKPRLGAFARAFPDIVLDLIIDDRWADLVSGGFDAGIRLGESLAPDRIAVPIGPKLRSAIVAAPSYLASTPPLTHPRDIAHHRCVRFRFSSGPLYLWELEKAGAVFEPELNGPLILDNDRMIVQAAIDGAGLAFVFEDYASEAIAAGQLVRLLDDWCPSFDGFYVYYASRRQMRPALRAFVDFFRLSK